MKEYFRLIKLLKPYKYLLILSFILIVLYSLSNAAAIYLSIPLLKTLFTGNSIELSTLPAKNYFDEFRIYTDRYIFSSGDKYESLIKVCILLISAYILKNIFAVMQGILTQYVEKSLITDLRRKMFDKFSTLSLNYFNIRKSGDIVSRFVTDVNSIQNTVSVTFTDLIKQPVMIIVFLTMAFFISWKLTLISVISVPLSVLFIIYIGKKLRKYGIRVQEKLAEFTSIIYENIYGIKIIRSFLMEEIEKKKFNEKLKDYFRSMMKNAVYINISRPITEIVSVSLGVFIIWFAGKEIFGGGGLAPEEFIGFLLIIFQLMVPIKDLSTVSNRIHESYASARRIFELIDAKAEIYDEADAVEKNEFSSKIEFKEVCFKYNNNDKLILDRINLEINKSEKIAIAGLSGVGKSTLIDLLPRFYDVTSGEILIDGINIKKIKLKCLRKLYSIVTQEVILFNDTIANNIKSGMEDKTIDEIIDAAKNANAHNFIIGTEEGYNTIIGERGLRLSGGQKQRIAIARAFLKNSPILILDEATSSLDNESEQLIQQAIERLMENKTAIIIAHRLSTIKDADRIAVLDNGKIAAYGTHLELMMNNDGIYRKLYELQLSQ